MFENRAVGTNGDILRRKHASQGKKVILFFDISFLEKLIKIYRVGRVGRVTPIKPPFLDLTVNNY